MKQTATPGGKIANRGYRFDFVGLSPLFGGLSALLTVLSLVLIFTKGLNYGIDFAGGTEIQVEYSQSVDAGKVRDFTEEIGFKSPSVQSIGEGEKVFVIRTDTVQGANEKETNRLLNETMDKFTHGLSKAFPDQEAKILRVDTVGPQIGDELKRNGLLAGFYSLLLILIYIGLRFDYQYAPGAVICLFHDCVVTLGVFSLVNQEVNIQTVAAVMTLIGFSLNDTIVNYDRIRENMPLYRDRDLRWIINRSVNDVLSRTLLTSFTTFISIIVLYFMAGGVIRDISFTLGIGMVIGTYSSVYVAAPMLLLIERLQGKKGAG